MKINDIVYHNSFKFGIVIGIESNALEVHFYSFNTNKKIVPSFLTSVDGKIVDYFLNGELESAFSYQTIIRGCDYQRQQRVSEIEFDGATFTADVKGSKHYKTKISFKNGQHIYSCSCPVEDNCKHGAALFYELNNIFVSLRSYADVKLTQKKLSKEIIDASTALARKDSIYENATIIIDDLSEKEDAYLILYLNYIYKNERPYTSNRYYSNNETMAYYVVAYNYDIRERILKLRNSNTIQDLYELNKYLQKGERLYNLGYYGNEIFSNNRNKYVDLYYVCNRRYEDYIIQSLNRNYYYGFDSTAIDFCCKHIKYKDDLYTHFVNSEICKIDRYKTLINIFPIDKRFEIYNNPKFSCELFYDDIKDFNHKDKLTLYKKIEIDQQMIDAVLNGDVDILNDNHRDAAAVLMRVYLFALKKKDKEDALRLMKGLPHNQYFIDYAQGFRDSFSDQDENSHFYYWHKNERKINKINIDFSNVNIDDFNEYFNVTFELDRKGKEIESTFRIYDIIDEPVIEIKKEDGLTYVTGNYFDQTYDGYYAQFLLWYIENIKNKEYEVAFNKILDEINEEVEAEKCENALEDMRNISQKIMRTNMLLVNQAKAKIEYLFNLDDMTLSLKVGIDKLYVVKDAVEFINAFNTEKIISYGKSLTLAHNLENLNESDAKIIDFLRKSRFSYEYERKYLSISRAMFSQLLMMLKNRYIVCDDKKYYVSLENIVPKISLDKDYRIHCDFDGVKNFKYVKANNNLYLLNNDENKIDVYEANASEIDFVVFALKYNGLRIKRIAQEFNNNLFTHFSDQMEIADELKKDFKVSSITIKAYFDYENKVVTVKEEYYKDDKKISINDFDDNDTIKLNVYKQYLSTIGFNDGIMANESSVLSFFYMDFDQIKKYCEVYLSESISNKKVSVFTPATIKVSYDGVIMKAVLEDSKYSDEELQAIMKALKHKKKFVLLHGDKIIDISDKNSEDFYETVDDLKLNIDKLNEESHISLIQSIKALAHQNNCSVDDYLTKMMSDIANYKNSDITIPKINGQLRNYQVDALKWLSILTKYNIGGILADDMGLGKSLEIISLICSSNKAQPSIIICPKTLVFNWKNEFNRFAPNIEVKEICGNKEDRVNIINSIAKNRKIIYVCSYDSLRNDIDEYKQTFEFAIIDEAQYIKNVNAQKTISIKKLKAEHKFALTGTPIENNLIDLWSIFDFVMPGYFDDLSQFKNSYNDEQFIQSVSKRVAPFVLRRVKQDVLKDLPEKYETIMSVDMGDSQRKLYDAFKNEVKQQLESGSKAFDILPYLTRLRQICVNPKMFIENYDGDIAKMELLDNIIDDYTEKGHKLLIFSQFVKALDEVETLLANKKVAYSVITGKTDGKKRIEIVDHFNNDENEKVLLISLKAGGTGLNLTGADTVIHLDPWWNVAAENQASDRAHRIGQKHNVEIIKIICTNSIEQRVIELQNIKKDLIDKVIANNDESIITSSLENIKYLLD